MSVSTRGWGGFVAGMLIGGVVGAFGHRALTCSDDSVGAVADATVKETSASPEAPAAAPVAMAEPAPVEPAVPAPATEPAVEEVAAEPESPAPNPDRQRGERIVQAQMKLVSDMVYKPFYEEVALDAETRAAAGTLLTESFGKLQQTQQQAMAKGDRTAAEVKVETDAVRDELREKLRGVLNADQLAAWEEYDTYSDRVLFEALLDGQLRMLAPELTIDSHQQSIAIFAEELERAINEFDESSKVYNLDNFNEAQYAGLVAGLQRLRVDLGPEQYDHAQGFADQAKAMFDAMKSQPAHP